jgi:glutathione S-transferase
MPCPYKSFSFLARCFLMDIILYGSRLSPFVEKVYRGLMLKRIPFKFHQPRSPLDIRRSNPTTKKMPALDLDGRRLFDSTLILRAIEECQPEPPFFSADPHLATQQRLLEDWADESLYWYGVALRWVVPANADRNLQVATADVPPIYRPLVKAVLPRLARLQLWAQGTGRLPLDILQTELEGHLTNLAHLLGEGPFFLGASRPSIADLAIFGQISFLHTPVSPESKAAVEKHPELLDWYRRLAFITN